MPTGYTAELMEKGQDFRTFALLCARAMGACIMQRDDPMTDEPKRQEPSDYHTKALEKALAERDRLSAMSSDERYRFGSDAKNEAINNAAKYLQRKQDENVRLDGMLADVVAWEPPSEDHTGLKAFMIEQITISRNDLSWPEKRLKEATGKPAKAFYEEALENAHRDIAYHRAELEKEAERTNGRNRWIDQLYASLENANGTGGVK